jgi:acetyltransferase-like isoleucine patch superfamily enzyme
MKKQGFQQPTFSPCGIKDVAFGRDVKIIEPCNLYGCEIGARCFVGPFTEIQSGVKIGSDCRIQSHSFICSNDKFVTGKPSPNPEDWDETWIGEEVSIGSGATILPVKVHSGCVIGAGSVVTKDLTFPGIYAGNPARFLRKL